MGRSAKAHIRLVLKTKAELCGARVRPMGSR